MAETVILQAPVAIVTIYENTARTSGRTFWNVVIDNKDKFTAFGRELVARFIDGRTPNKIPGRDGAPDSLVYNFSPPLNTVLFFEAKSTGKVLCSPPDGTPVPPVTQLVAALPAAGVAPTPGGTVGTPAGFKGRPSYGGYQKTGKDWKPRDERPSLVTMTMAYSKDLVTAIIGNNDDLKICDRDMVSNWACEQTLKLAKMFLNYTLAELKAMGVKLEPEK